MKIVRSVSFGGAGLRRCSSCRHGLTGWRRGCGARPRRGATGVGPGGGPWVPGNGPGGTPAGPSGVPRPDGPDEGPGGGGGTGTRCGGAPCDARPGGKPSGGDDGDA